MSVFSPDGRTKVSDTRSFPFSAVGMMRMHWKGPDGVIDTADDIIATASGAMIDPYHFLTAGHCVYYTKNGGWADKIEVMLGSKGNIIDPTNRADYEYYSEAKSVHIRSYKAWTDGDQTKPKTVLNLDYDLGLVTLDRNIGNFTGWFDYGYDDNLSSGTLMNVTGYPSDKFDSNGDQRYDNYDMWTQSGKITSTTNLRASSTDLDVAPGSSGGPLWAYKPNTNEPTIYGVLSTGDLKNPTPYKSSGFTRITSTRYNDIKNSINADNTTRKPTDKADLVDYDTWFNTTIESFSQNTIKHGENFSITVYPRNNGTAATGTFSVSFYASTDKDVTNSIGSHYLIGNTTVSSINPFNLGTATWSGAFPNIPIGNYFVVSYLDPNNSIQEFDDSPDSNQKVFSDRLTVGNDTITGGTGSGVFTINTASERIDNIKRIDNITSFSFLDDTDTIKGLAGNDTITGGTGSGVFAINTRSQRIDNITRGNNLLNGGVGNDTLNANFSTGNNTLNGGEGNDTLNANYSTGNNTLIGGVGNDYLSIGASPSDISYNPALGNNTLIGGVGNDTLNANYSTGNNTLIGGVGNDTLSANYSTGNNTLDGGEGNDTLNANYSTGNNTLIGGVGNDYLSIGASPSDISYNPALGNNTLIGGVGNDTLNANDSTGDNLLDGGDSNDTIYVSASGKDTINGGYGDDLLSYNATYINNNLTEGITSTFNTTTNIGSITVGTNIVSYNNIERLDILGTQFDDLIVGSNGNDILTGGNGNDTLIGGSGTDTFAFNSFNKGVDKIYDFNATDELIQVSAAGFGRGLSIGSLQTSQFQFTIGASATTSQERFIYNNATGGLFFDLDGSASGFTQVQFAQLSTGLSLTEKNFVVV